MPYIIVPDTLLDRYRHDPLIIAIYTGIGRCCLAQRGPVVLSAPDLATWLGMPGEPGRVTIMRRIQRLAADGWLVTTTRLGSKAVLTPTWGRSRDGEVRVWDWSKRGRGQPAWQRGRRIPLAVFDTYLGRIIPHPTRPADLQCWSNQALLDGIDVGTWISGLRGDIQPTPRLRQLGITSDTLPTLNELRERMRSGRLTTLEEQGTMLPVAESDCLPEMSGRTRSRSQRSPSHTSGSAQSIDYTSDSAAQTTAECAVGPYSRSQPLIAWDHESSNNMIPPLESDHEKAGSGDDQTAHVQGRRTPAARSHTEQRQPSLSDDRLHHTNQEVIDGHRALNPSIAIPIGEWLELALLEQQHGVAQILIWQARALRRTEGMSGRVIPAYYRACAARADADLYQPQYPARQHKVGSAPPIAPETAVPDSMMAGQVSSQCRATIPAQPALMPEADELLRAMGLRQRHALAAVPVELIRQWQPLVDHPALVARFPRDHRGWIWTQLRDQLEPPGTEELAAWERATHAHAPTDWRSLAHASDGLMRLGDDLEGVPELPTELPPNATRSTTVPTDDLATQFRSELRLRSADRALRQALDRAKIELYEDNLLLRCLPADLRLLLTHSGLLRAAATGTGYLGNVQLGNVQCVAV